MKAQKWMLLALIALLATAVFFCFGACGDDDDDDDDDDEQEEEELPECEYTFPSEPACTDTTEVNGLTWTVCDTGEDIDHFCATHYVSELSVAGSEDWRLPTIAELSALYDENNSQNVGCQNLPVQIMEPFVLSCGTIWSSETAPAPGGGDGAKYFTFFGIGSEITINRDHRPNMRVLAVAD